MSFADLILLLLKASIFLTVFALGLQATVDHVLYVLRRPALLARSLLAMYIMMPIVAVALAVGFDFIPSVEIALLALAVSPVPPLLPKKEFKAGGRASYTIGLLVAVTLLAIVIEPLAVQAEGWLAGRRAYLGPVDVARLAFTSALLPLAGGMLFRRLAPDIARKVASPLMSVAAIMLVAGVVPILFAVWPAIASLIGNGTLVAFATFAIVALAVGHLLGGPDPDDRTVLALSTASRHPAIALAIAHASLPDDKTVLAAVLLYLVVSAMAAIPYVNWRKGTESRHIRLAVAIACAICCAGRASPARAQGVEIMPFGGYRFGGDLFELATARPLDLDGAPALGVVVNVPLSDGLQVEALVARQDAHASTPTTAFHAATRQHLTVDHWQGG